MAFINQLDKDKNKDQQQQPQQLSGGVQQPSSIQPATPTTPKGTSSGSFANLSGYLNANKNFNAQGGGLAGKVAGNLQNQATEAKQNITEASKTFSNQSGSQVQKAQEGANLATQAVSDPTAFMNDQLKVNMLSNVRDTGYTGPKSLSDLQGTQSAQNLQNQAQNITSNVQQAQTEKGRFNLLNQMFNKPSYNSGQQTLDNLLIQGNKDQLKKLENTRKLSGQVNQGLSTAQANADVQGADAANKYAAQRGALMNTLTGGVKDIENTVAGRVKSYNDSDISQKVADDIASGNFHEDTLAALGISPDQMLYNTDLRNYVTNLGAATAANTATKDEYAKYNALTNLAKTDPTFLNQNDIDQAGTGGIGNGVKVDKDKLLSDINNAKNTYSQLSSQNRNQWQNLFNQMNDLQGKIAKSGNRGWERNERDAALAQWNAYFKQQQALDQELNNLQNQYQINRKVNKIT